jgi:hypothetical protein
VRSRSPWVARLHHISCAFNKLFITPYIVGCKVSITVQDGGLRTALCGKWKSVSESIIDIVNLSFR